MNQILLRRVALLFVALVIFQSLLGGWLFVKTIGFSPSEIMAHYGDKTFHGFVEVAFPHALFIAVALMATLHFLAFIPAISDTSKRMMSHLLFGMFLLDQGAPAGIMAGWEMFAYLKAGAFIGFEIVLGWTWIVIFRHSLRAIGEG